MSSFFLNLSDIPRASNFPARSSDNGDGDPRDEVDWKEALAPAPLPLQ
jgi:hypothetical protein